MKRVYSLICLSFMLLFCLTSGVAQTGTTSLRGTVVDKSGGAIVAATVILRSQEQSFVRQASTNDTGAYEFLALPPGRTR